MTQHTISGETQSDTGCTPSLPVRITRSLLGYGVIVGPIYVVASLTQALTREGFDLSRHAWSMLANGDLGWIQVVNFALAGVMLVAMAVGLHRALASGKGSVWAPKLVAVFGLSMVVAAIFKADPALGFPVGTPEGPGPVSTAGLIHLAAGGIGFTCIAAACFVLARRYASEGRRGFAAYSIVTGVAFLTAFTAMAASGGNVIANLVFTAAVILVFSWTTLVSRDWYRRAATTHQIEGE